MLFHNTRFCILCILLADFGITFASILLLTLCKWLPNQLRHFDYSILL